METSAAEESNPTQQPAQPTQPAEGVQWNMSAVTQRKAEEDAADNRAWFNDQWNNNAGASTGNENAGASTWGDVASAWGNAGNNAGGSTGNAGNWNGPTGIATGSNLIQVPDKPDRQWGGGWNKSIEESKPQENRSLCFLITHL